MVKYNLGELDDSAPTKKRKQKSSAPTQKKTEIPENLKSYILDLLKSELPFPVLLWSDVKEYIIKNQDDPKYSAIAWQITQKKYDKPYRELHELVQILLREKFEQMKNIG